MTLAVPLRDALEQFLHFGRVERFPLPQRRREGLELVSVRGEDGAGRGVRAVDKTADLVVDPRRDALRVLGCVAHVAADEDLLVRTHEADRPEQVAHAELRDHATRDLGRAVDVVVRARRRIVEHQFFGSAATQEHGHLVLELATRAQEAILGGQHQRVPERATTRDDRDLVHRVLGRERVGDERVAGFVVGDDAALALGDHARPALGAGDDAFDCRFELRHPDLFHPAARGEQRGFVQQVREVGTGHARRSASDDVEIDPGRDRLVVRVHAHDALAPFEIRRVDDDLAVEAAGAQQCGIEHVGSVRRRDEDHAGAHVEAVELDEHLVERLLALIVPTTDTGTALPTHRVDLVDEDDRAPDGFGALEQIAHTRRADAREHLDEVAAGHGEERNPRLPRDRTRQQRLPRAGRPEEQHALRDRRTDRREPFRFREEVLDLAQLLDGFVEPRDVGERHRRAALVGGDRAGTSEPEDRLPVELDHQVDRANPSPRRAGRCSGTSLPTSSCARSKPGDRDLGRRSSS